MKTFQAKGPLQNLLTFKNLLHYGLAVQYPHCIISDAVFMPLNDCDILTYAQNFWRLTRVLFLKKFAYLKITALKSPQQFVGLRWKAWQPWA